MGRAQRLQLPEKMEAKEKVRQIRQAQREYYRGLSVEARLVGVDVLRASGLVPPGGVAPDRDTSDAEDGGARSSADEADPDDVDDDEGEESYYEYDDEYDEDDEMAC